MAGDHNQRDECSAARARLPWRRPEVARLGAAGAEAGDTIAGEDGETSKS